MMLFQADGQMLTIQKAQESDAGLYTCVAANEAGSVEQNYLLDVWGRDFFLGFFIVANIC